MRDADGEDTRGGRGDATGGPVLVLGGPRTGSSAIAGAVHALGVSMGERLLGPDRWNQLGYYEDRDFLAMHRLMAFPYGDPARIALRLPSAAPDPPARLRRRYAEAAARRADGGGPWGLKDPRLLFLLEVVRPLYPAPPTRVIVARRDDAESAASLARMFAMGPAEAAAIVAAYADRRDRVLRSGALGDAEVLEVDYAGALAAPGRAVARIAAFLGIAPEAIPPAAVDALDPSLRRHRLA